MAESPEELLKQEKMLKLARKVWLFLIPLFAVIILLNLYNWWTDGKVSFPSILSPLGMIFLGLATISGTRNKALSVVFLVLGMIAVLGGLVTAFMKH